MKLQEEREFYNDPEDFKVPWSIYGSVTFEVEISKYFKLNNKPKHFLEVRKLKW